MGPFQTLPARTWSFTVSSTGGLTTTTPQSVHQPNPGNRSYITDLAVWNYSSSGSTVVVITDAGSAVWQGEFGQYAPGIARTFNTPIRCSVGGQLLLQALASGQKVFANIQGFDDSQ